MGINVEIEQRTIVFLGIIVFLVAELATLTITIDNIVLQLANLQKIDQLLIASNNVVAWYYIATNVLNQILILGLAAGVFYFLYRFSEKPIELLSKMIEKIR